MSALGIAVTFSGGSNSRPVVTCVLLECSADQPCVKEVFDLKTSETQIVDQICVLGKALSSKLAGLEGVEVIRIRVADAGPTGSRRNAPKHRLMIEGALVLICCKSMPGAVLVRNGKELGKDLELNKEQALTRGGEIDSRRQDAAAAALAGLRAIPPDA